MIAALAIAFLAGFSLALFVRGNERIERAKWNHGTAPDGTPWQPNGHRKYRSQSGNHTLETKWFDRNRPEPKRRPSPALSRRTK